MFSRADTIPPWLSRVSPSRAIFALEILRAAHDCFSKWGIERTRMDDISRAVGISRPSLYNYFPNKEALFRATLAVAAERFDAYFTKHLPIEGPSSDLIVERFAQGIERALSVGYIREVLVNSERQASGLSPAIAPAATAPEVMEIMDRFWKRILAHAAEQGELRSGIDQQRTIRWIVLMTSMVLEHPEVFDQPDELRAFARTMIVPGLIIQPDDRVTSR